ncbi:hypothetical protein TNIN_159751 [Trichonephila inaurata madagascariensis]|uniref:Uncharacterized protein n=1 Tax=Trichonephila inaurata madagascariensis TaxID=2747483 RepID=A0A8X7CM47_9ARAC|nr:hypothetical protein TNIN_159751 [Trichonephila inaurata madagascariensis]
MKAYAIISHCPHFGRKRFLQRNIIGATEVEMKASLNSHPQGLEGYVYVFRQAGSLRAVGNDHPPSNSVGRHYLVIDRLLLHII